MSSQSLTVQSLRTIANRGVIYAAQLRHVARDIEAPISELSSRVVAIGAADTAEALAAGERFYDALSAYSIERTAAIGAQVILLRRGDASPTLCREWAALADALAIEVDP